MNIIEVSKFLKKYGFAYGLYNVSTNTIEFVSKRTNSEIFITINIPYNEEKDLYELILLIDSKMMIQEFFLSKKEFKANLAKASTYIIDYIELMNIGRKTK